MKPTLLKNVPLYGFDFQKPITKTFEDGFNEGKLRYESQGDLAYMGFMPQNEYERGILAGFDQTRNADLG